MDQFYNDLPDDLQEDYKSLDLIEEMNFRINK